MHGRFSSPNEANGISYHRGQGHILKDHCDHRSLSGKILVNLSLVSHARLDLIRVPYVSYAQDKYSTMN